MMAEKYVMQVLIAGTALAGLFAFALLSFIWVQKRKQNAHYAERGKLQNALLEERERTMNEISAEIHDHLAQLISITQMNLKAACEAENREESIQLIQTANSLLAETGDALQNIGHFLSSEYVKQNGLVDTLSKELEYISFSNKLQCHFDVEGTTRSFDPEKELLIYRIAQEAIHNAIKHSKATEITILFKYNPFDFRMVVADNGIGLPDDKEVNTNGIGIINMRRRAELLNGDISIASATAKGVTITLSCPLYRQ